MLYCSLLYIDKLIMQFHIQFRINCLSVVLMLYVVYMLKIDPIEVLF